MATKSEKKPPAKTAAKKEAAPKADAPAKAETKAAADLSPEEREKRMTEAKARLASAGRNDACPCGSGKKYKKCHLQEDEGASVAPVAPPNPQEMILNGWRLFEQRRPGAAEKEFAAALKLDPALQEARVGIGMARLSAGNSVSAEGGGVFNLVSQS